MMKISHVMSVVVLGLFSAVASASTVWQPTNQDTDFIQFDSYGITTNGGTLALFDAGTSNYLVIGSSGGQVTFTSSGSDYIATFQDSTGATIGSPLNLGTSNDFTLGMSWDGGKTWYGDSSHVLSGGSPDTYLISFNGTSMQAPITGSTLAVDLAPVPVPAAVWLFGSGIIGLVGVARRRRA